MSQEEENDHQTEHLEDEEYDSEKKPHKPISCIFRTQNCTSKDCEKIIECEPNSSSLGPHCYAMTKFSLTENKYSTNSTIVQMKPEEVEIITAGCWTGGDECRKPSDLFKKYNDKSLKISSELLDETVQNSCIGYSKSTDDSGYLAKNNMTFCCCSTSMCNSHLVYTHERNPFELYASENNPKTKEHHPVYTKNYQIRTTQPPGVIITYSQLNFFLLIFLITVSLIICAGILFMFYRRRLKRSPNSSIHLPSIFYQSKPNSGDLLSTTTNTTNVNRNTNNILNAQKAELHELEPLKPTPVEDTMKQNILNDYFQIPNLNSNNNCNLMGLNDDFKHLGQPLLTQAPPFACTIAAPNVQVISPPVIVIGNDKSAPKKNIGLAESLMGCGELNLDNPNSLSGGSDTPVDTALPRKLQATDINLLDKIAHGQFSCVWKGRCKTSDESEEPQYAVKIFNGHQKSAWQNEKDIYNCMLTSNDNILRYYGADVNNTNQNPHQSMPGHPHLFMTQILSNEYWLITEYHPSGTLYDYLKNNLLSWPEMVRMCNSIVEGIAYLHTENPDARKPFAIAHRDLKSKNILVKKGSKLCCIADFGLALKLTSNNKLSSAEIRSKVNFDTLNY